MYPEATREPNAEGDPEVQHAGSEDERDVHIVTIAMTGVAGVHHVILNNVPTKASRTDTRGHGELGCEPEANLMPREEAPAGVEHGTECEANLMPREETPAGIEHDTECEANLKPREEAEAPAGVEHSY